MRRPGNLNGVKTSRARRSFIYGGLGNFGKSKAVVAPAPGAPPEEDDEDDDEAEDTLVAEPQAQKDKKAKAQTKKQAREVEAKASAAEKARIEKELLELESAEAEISTIPSEAPMMPSAASYTGGGGSFVGPSYSDDNNEDASPIAALVAQHQERMAGPVAPPPVSVSVPATPPMPKTGIVSWFKALLFGTSGAGLGGYGEMKMSTPTKIAILAAAGYLIYTYKFKK